MAARARAEQEDLAIRLAGLEARLRELEQRPASAKPPGATLDDPGITPPEAR